MSSASEALKAEPTVPFLDLEAALFIWQGCEERRSTSIYTYTNDLLAERLLGLLLGLCTVLGSLLGVIWIVVVKNGLDEVLLSLEHAGNDVEWQGVAVLLEETLGWVKSEDKTHDKLITDQCR
jgi:hypothetical protein